MAETFDLYTFPADYIGRRTYVSVRGHSRSVPVIYTYKGTDRLNYILPEYGGDMSGYENYAFGVSAPMILRDCAEYVSPLDNTVISSRSSHREHLNRHGVIEVGNERLKSPRPDFNMPSAGVEIKKVLDKARAA